MRLLHRQPGGHRARDHVAAEFGTEHHQIRVSSRELLSELPAAIRAMGLKDAAKALMVKAGVPVPAP